MTSTSFTTTFAVDRSPQQVYDAINDVRAWWSAEIDGPTDAEGETFTFRVKDLHRSLIASPISCRVGGSCGRSSRTT